MPNREIKKIARDFRKAATAQRMRPVSLYIYGSYADGRATPDSDIDIAVVLPRVSRGKKRLDANIALHRIAARVDARIEPFVLDQTEFRTRATPMARAVARTGVRVQ